MLKKTLFPPPGFINIESRRGYFFTRRIKMIPSLSILYADPHEIIGGVFSRIIIGILEAKEIEGEIKVHTAINGIGAFLEFRSKRPDIIVIDTQISDMDGLDLIRKIREESNGQIIIALTPNEFIIEEAKKAGADEAFEKWILRKEEAIYNSIIAHAFEILKKKIQKSLSKHN